MGFAIAMAIAMYIVFYDDIQAYKWSKKSADEKYAAFRAYVNAWNGTNYD